MPSKNRIKQYSEGGHYHLYNRGAEKRPIFHDQQDYSVFLSYLKEYLTPKDTPALFQKLTDRRVPPPEKEKTRKKIKLNNFSGEITLLTYCLMPNHFHLLIKQKGSGSIDKFMNSLGTRYTMYFNKKYKRVGPLYQGVYKAILVSTDEYLLHLSRYIHRQAGHGQPSSYPYYISSQQTEWVNPEEILIFFSKNNPKLSYKSFVTEDDNLDFLYDYTLEEQPQ